MVKGSSPAETLHKICADAPSSKISFAKAIEPNSGGTEMKNWQNKNKAIHADVTSISLPPQTF